MIRCKEYAECGNCQCTGAEGHEGDHCYDDQQEWEAWWANQEAAQ